MSLLDCVHAAAFVCVFVAMLACVSMFKNVSFSVCYHVCVCVWWVGRWVLQVHLKSPSSKPVIYQAFFTRRIDCHRSSTVCPFYPEN